MQLEIYAKLTKTVNAVKTVKNAIRSRCVKVDERG